MPNGFVVKGPDGKEWDVDVPQGATEADAIAYVKNTYYDKAPDPLAGTHLQSGPAFTGLSRTINNFADSFRHADSVAKRALVQAAPTAALGLPALAADAYTSLDNLVRKGINGTFGTDLPYQEPFKYSRSASDAGVAAADAMGLDVPQTKAGSGALNIGTAALSALGGAGLAGGAARSISGMPQAASGMSSIFDRARTLLMGLAETPALQMAGAAGGALATEAARQANLGPAATLGLGVVGSIAPGGAATVGQRAVNMGRALARPITTPGRDIVAGQVLNRLATNRNLAPMRMDAAQELVPGSAPTMAQVSMDPGLIAAEKSISSVLDPTGRLMQRRSDQNTARQNYLDQIIMPSRPVPEGVQPQRGTLEYAQAKRDATIDTHMDPAFAGASRVTPENLQSVFSTLDRIRSDKRVGPRLEVQKAIKFAEERLQQPGVDVFDPETLYAIRKDLNTASQGKYRNNEDLALARGQLVEVIRSVDGTIDAAAPGYRRYMDLYSSRSVPLDQQKFLRDLRAQGQDSVSDPATGLRMLTAGKFSRAFERSIASGALRDARVSDQILNRLHAVAADLDRGAATQSATVRSHGSDTMRNFSVASVIGSVLGSNAPETFLGKSLMLATRPISFLYGSADEAIGQILLEATLDPQLGARLMRGANRYEVESVARELAKRAAAQGVGNAIYNGNGPWGPRP